jgi:ketosteroid isomerase-like protein
MGAIARFFEPFHQRRKVSLVSTRGTDSAQDEEIKREAAADVEEIEQDDKYFAPETPEDRDDLLSPVPAAREVLMPDDASAAGEPATLAERIRAALGSGDLDAIKDLLDPDARWGAPEGPGDDDCRNRDQVIAWWARARATGARAVVTEVTAGPGTLLVGLEVTGTPAAQESGGAARRWQVLTIRGGRVADIRGFEDRTTAAARARVPA